jgi:GNAT superfamily N-acetyltransferase
MDGNYELLEGSPTVEEYLRLRAESGLSPKREDQAKAALAGTWHMVHVRHRPTGEAVAMGRVIGDGGWYFQIADMATLPDHQRQGLGRLVLTTLVAVIRDRAPDNPWITLLADPPGIPLYTSLGFQPTKSLGMAWES